MFLTYNTVLIRAGIQLLLFLTYWSRFSGEYGLLPAMLTVLFSGGGALLIAKRIKSTPGALAAGILFPLSLFPLLRGLSFLLPAFPLPLNFSGVLLHSILLLVLPAVLPCIGIHILAGRFRWMLVPEAGAYTVLLSLLVGRQGWGMILFRGSYLLTFSLFCLILFGLYLLLLAGGRTAGRISLFPGVPAALLLILAVLIPADRLYRAESLKEGGGLLETALFRFDFSDFLTLESQISMKDDLVFLFRKEGPGERLLLRRFVLNGYSRDKGFFREPGEAFETPSLLMPEYSVPESPREWDIPEYERREWVKQDLYLVNFDSSAFLGMNLPGRITPYDSWEDSSFSRIYQVESSVSQAWGWELIDSPPPEPGTDFVTYYTEYGDQEDIRLLAEEITGRLPGYYLKVQALEDYFRKEFLYSLKPGKARDGDQLRHFLFTARKGYCSYFAFSMTLMCRSLGIPARVALGFWVDPGKDVLNFYPVNANQAHAWVEVYFPDMGWIEFDPTSQNPAPGESFVPASYSPEELEPFIEEILQNQGLLTVSRKSEPEEEPSAARFWRERWSRLRSRPVPAVFLLAAAWMIVNLIRFLFPLRRRPVKRKRVPSFYRAHCRLAGRIVRPRGADESRREYAVALEERGFPAFREYTDLYLMIRFGGKDVRGVSRLFTMGSRVRRELYSSLSPGGRIRLFLTILLIPGGRR